MAITASFIPGAGLLSVIGDSLDTHNIHLLQRRIAISFFSNFSESRREFTRAVRLEGVLGPHSRPP